MRKEPILFAAIAVLGGLFVAKNLGGAARTKEPRGGAKDYAGLPIPDVSRSGIRGDRDVDFGRDLFTQPRDTTPLPPLGLVAPPLESFGAVAPPTAWGPAPRLHAKFLRTPTPQPDGVLEPGLFEPVEDVELSEVAATFDPDDPDQRAARIEGFKRQYDWIYTTNFKFGQIRNDDRYRLESRPNEKLEFFEVDPTTGQGKFVGINAVVSYERSRIQEFGFAATPANEVELGRVEFGAQLTATDFERALRFADRCIELRNEAPRALEIAEEMYRLADEINLQGDLRPRLGLGLCYELGFRFERAFDTYTALLEKNEGGQARVLAHLGNLRARLRLDRRAEDDLRRAVELARADPAVRQLYGRFLMERGRFDEALAQFSAAADAEPRGDDAVRERVELRLDLAGALLANGRMEDALDRFSKALSADLDDSVGRAQVAVAGMGAAALLVSAGTGDARGLPAASSSPDAGFELLMTQGLAALRRQRWTEARSALEFARGADPFRAHLALGALSFLAEVTGHPEEALGFIEEAFTANPVDTWVLYQRGRLLAVNGDINGAEACFRAALDRELDYVPALEELGALRNELGDFDGAELYFERALNLEPERAVTWARRGFNHIRRGDLPAAKACFDRARIARPGLASGALGLAWVAYATGDTTEALTLFAQVEEDRRNAGPQDPVRAYAKQQGDRIRDHETKETWRDRFDREAGRIANDWRQEEGFGPETLLRDGQVVLEGTLERAGRTRVFRELSTERFLSFFAEVTVLPDAAGTTNGIFISVERDRTGQSEAQAEILLARNRDGVLQAKVRRSSSDDGEWKDALAGPPWPVGKPVRVGIERVGDEGASTFTLYVAGEPVFTGLPGDGIQRSKLNVRFGVFTEGMPGRKAALRFDDVEVVRRR
ncbi:MAG: tetratricopeptide repeat protein [Planctomycetota bacterium]